MTKLSIREVREELAETLNKVSYRGERVVIKRRGKDIAAIIPMEDLEALEELEDRLDVEEAVRRLKDPKEIPIPYERIRKEFGLK